MTENHDCAVGTAFANTDIPAVFFESRKCIGIANNNQANWYQPADFSVREQFAAAFAR
jgi:hypothetical protein